MNTETMETAEEVKPAIRQIVIETDGDMVRIVKAETAGEIELHGILSSILAHLQAKRRA